MTFDELSRQTATARRLPEGQSVRASVQVSSAEGRPNKDLGIEVRPPSRITSAQTAKVRGARASRAA